MTKQVEDLTPAEARRLLIDAIPESDREHSLIYLDIAVTLQGTEIGCFDSRFTMPWDGYVGFVDLDPMANWGHACLYLLVRAETGEVQKVEAQFPPFMEASPPSLRMVMRYGKSPKDEHDLEIGPPEKWSEK